MQSEAGPRACYSVTGGTLAVEAEPGQASIRVTCTGTTPVRLVVASGADEAELARAVKRRPPACGSSQRRVPGRPASSIVTARSSSARTPCWRAVSRGRVRGATSRSSECPASGAALLSGCSASGEEAAWCFGVDTCAAAAAQLIAGDRDPARELLKFLAQAQHPDGSIPAELPLGGLGSRPDAPSTAAFLELAARTAAWTGDLDSSPGLSGALARALSLPRGAAGT